MGLLSAAERLSAIDRKAVAFAPGRCLHSIDKYVECEACYQVCPVDAIDPGKPPGFSEDVCQSCLACIPVCPTGAYAAEDAVPALLKCAVRMEARHVELACEAHPTVENGPEDSEIAVRIRGCLAGMGAGGYLSLFALGKQKVIVRLDACKDCPWGTLQEKIIQQIDETKTYLSAWNLADRFEVILDIDADNLQERPLWEAENPPLSRRDLFKFASQRGQLMAARAMNVGSASQTESRPSPNRMRLAAAAAQLPEISTDLSGLSGFASISISEDCTACAACERACPTGAIEYALHEFKTFDLKFQPDHCIGCGICQQVCVPEAITINHQPTFAEIFSQDEPVLLLEGEVTRCERCNVVMAKKPEVYLCPICQHRRENPFGGQLPPKLMRLIKNQANQEKKQ